MEHHTKNDTLPSGGRWGPHEAQRLRGEKEEQGSGRMFFLSKKNGAKRTLLRRGDPITIINEHLFFYNTTLVQITKVSRFRTQIYAKE